MWYVKSQYVTSFAYLDISNNTISSEVITTDFACMLSWNTPLKVLCLGEDDSVVFDPIHAMINDETRGALLKVLEEYNDTVQIRLRTVPTEYSAIDDSLFEMLLWNS